MNCNFIIYIKEITNILGSDDHYEICVDTFDNKTNKIIFDHAVMMHYAVERAFLNRWPSFEHCEQEISSILKIENSRTIKQFEKQLKGSRSITGLKEYIIHDEIDSIIEVLTYDEPKLIQ